MLLCRFGVKFKPPTPTSTLFGVQQTPDFKLNLVEVLVSSNNIDFTAYGRAEDLTIPEVIIEAPVDGILYAFCCDDLIYCCVISRRLFRL